MICIKSLKNDLESYNSFNVFTASQKYIEYLETQNIWMIFIFYQLCKVI